MQLQTMRSSVSSLKARATTTLAAHALPTFAAPCVSAVHSCSTPRRHWFPARFQTQLACASKWLVPSGHCMISSRMVMHARASPSDSSGSSSNRKPGSGGGRAGTGGSRGRPQLDSPRQAYSNQKPRGPRPPSQPADVVGDPWSQGVSAVSSSSGKSTPLKPSLSTKQQGASSTSPSKPTPAPAQSQQQGKPKAAHNKSPSLPASTASGVPKPPADDQTPEQHEANFQAAVTAHGLSQVQVTQLYTYLDYLLETNKVMNLTAVRDRSEALTRHLVDSLALLPVLDQHLAAIQAHEAPEQPPPGSVQLIDVGTGAGLPGMVLAIARPQWKVTLLDSLRKRCDFLSRAAELAGLTNVHVVWSRAEDGGRRADLRDMYDVAVARAVADARVLAELCLPFVRPGGVWVAAKGPDPEVEVDAAATAISKLGGVKLALHRVQSHSADGQRTALVVSKAKPTPAAYPRAPGTPNKSPL